jgi:hypothetical protein
MVPGMNHCRGGAGAVNFGQSGVVPVSLDPEHDAVLALQRWVEQGVAPDMLISTTDQPLATHAAENPTRPLLSPGHSVPILKRRSTRASAIPPTRQISSASGADHDHDGNDDLMPKR